MDEPPIEDRDEKSARIPFAPAAAAGGAAAAAGGGGDGAAGGSAVVPRKRRGRPPSNPMLRGKADREATAAAISAAGLSYEEVYLADEKARADLEIESGMTANAVAMIRQRAVRQHPHPPEAEYRHRLRRHEVLVRKPLPVSQRHRKLPAHLDSYIVSGRPVELVLQ